MGLVIAITFLSFGNKFEGNFFLAVGVGVFASIGTHLMWLFRPLFGFPSPETIAFPLTSLGSAGAAIGTTWSGYLSTHVGMMDALDSRSLTTKAIFSHTIGGLVSGITANYIFILVSLL